ncbi:MAG TPA: 2OG-Fe(II) oxygenase [Burkholderiales bacterium]|nr:2OG-Fe(II) oxygenase [Burkholderiales bacterium]
MICAESVAEALAEHGWATVTDFLPAVMWRALAAEVRAARAAGGLRPAGVGRGERYRLADDVRGDQIRWLDPIPASTAQREVLSRLDQLRATVNRELQLGLLDFEGHFALYPPGTAYRRHCDQHRGSQARVLSCVVYLNADWKAEHGGVLRLYLDQEGGGDQRDVLPEGGKLVCFLSERFWHEVLPAARERLSLTGWFRRRS